MKLPRTLLLAGLALSLAAGCGISPTGGKLTGARGTAPVRAKLLSFDDVVAIVGSRTGQFDSQVEAGMPAVMAAPTDVVVQRGLENVYGAVVRSVVGDIDPVVEESMAESVGREVKPELLDNPEVQAYVQGIADRISKAANLPRFKAYVLDVPEENAFNAGGNAIFIFSGLILAAADEAELAGVIAHEMMHGRKRHALQGLTGGFASLAARRWVGHKHPATPEDAELTRSILLTLTPAQARDKDFVLGYLQGKVGPAQMINVRFDLNSKFARQTHGRAMEGEADAFGVRALSAAGYDPRAMADNFDRWNRYPDGDLRYYSHPALGQRVGAIRYLIDTEGLANGPNERAPERLAAIKAKIKGEGGPAAPGGTKLPVHLQQFLCR